ncbi:MAG TPA: phage tail protein [Longimicrobiaceae bacterium]
MALEDDRKLLGTFNFVVSLRRSATAESGLAGTAADPAAGSSPGEALCDGGFQECSGLDIEMDVQELQEGGRNDGVIRRVGRGKYSNIVLKRGMFYAGGGNRVNTALWGWLQGILTGTRPVPRYDGIIQVLGADGATVMATWTFSRGLPSKVSGPQLNAKSGDVAIEELHIAHEGLKLAI